MSIDQGVVAGKLELAARDVSAARSLTAVRAWLWIVAATIGAMVMVGGATRLTESGLSITEWEPLFGAIPPLSAAAWEAKFEAYRQIPQFALHSDMTLSEFKGIFFWEWTHRFIGRALGLVIALPLAGFWIMGRLTGALKLRLVVLLLLVGLQGAVGWWMVKSGLVERTEVSQYRLATHLLLATLTLGYVVWIARGLSLVGKPVAPAGLRAGATLLAAMIFVQIGFGALVAGLRAGLIYNTWPLMGTNLIPPMSELFASHPAWRNSFENLTTVQFQHRMFAYAVLIVAIVHAFTALRRKPGSPVARQATAVLLLLLAQVGLGITALLLVVPLPIALAHQAVAILAFATAIYHRRSMLDAGGQPAAARA